MQDICNIKELKCGSLADIKKEYPTALIVDHYNSQLEELFLLRNPKYKFEPNYKDDLDIFIKEYYKDNDSFVCGKWFFYPWLNSVIHVLSEDLFFEMKTGRNRNLITKEEQEKYYNSTVGVLGLSVGSHIALTVAMTGGVKRFKIADPDTISGSNLNRIRTGVQEIGLKKTASIARKIFEINPYSKIDIFDEGIDDKNMDDFFDGLDLLVEEMDNPYFKIKVRYYAKDKGVPVVMGTDNGDNIFVDIERYDKDKNLMILNGLVGDISLEQLKNFESKDLPKIAAKIAGADLATTRMQNSVLEVGKTLYSWPQLGTAANLCGSAVAYLVRKIILKDKNIKSGRYEVNLDGIFQSDYHSKNQKEYRKNNTKDFFKKMGISL